MPPVAGDFVEDVRRLWAHASSLFAPGSNEHRAAHSLSSHFEVKLYAAARPGTAVPSALIQAAQAEHEDEASLTALAGTSVGGGASMAGTCCGQGQPPQSSGAFGPMLADVPSTSTVEDGDVAGQLDAPPTGRDSEGEEEDGVEDESDSDGGLGWWNY